MRALLALLLCLTLPVAAAAQEDSDRGFIAGLLEDALGGEGREVRVIGFDGLLSSTATIERITIADPEGVWLEIEDAELQWSRRALLSGRIEIGLLAAQRISLPRLPEAQDSVDVPDAESTPFALPDLPVSVELDRLEASEIFIGAPILGQDATFNLTGSLSLIDGTGNIRLDGTRLDGGQGTIAVQASYANESRALDFDVALSEGEGGIGVSLLGIPGAPAADVTAQGQGTLSDLNATLTIASDGVERLGGRFRILPQDDGGTRFSLNVDGDVTGLLAPQYQTFFGESTVVEANGARDPDGALSIDALRLRTNVVTVDGSLDLTPAGWPSRFALQGAIVDDSGARITLPVSGDPLTLNEARFTLSHDAAQSDDWTLLMSATDVQRGDIAIGELALDGIGTLDATEGAGAVTANLTYGVTGFDGPADLARALGNSFGGDVELSYATDAPLDISAFTLGIGQTNLQGAVQIDDFANGLPTRFDVRLNSDDIERFSGIAGRDLTGQADLRFEGTADLSGAFDIRAEGDLRDATIGQPQADALLAGQTTLRADIARSPDGIEVREFDLSNPQLSATAQGAVDNSDGTLNVALQLNDLSLLVPQVSGPVTLDGTAARRDGVWNIDTRFDAPQSVGGTATARLAEDTQDVSFDVTVPDISAYAEGIEGSARLSGDAQGTAQGLTADVDFTGPYDTTGTLDADLRGDTQIVDLDVTVPDLSSFVPSVQGAASLTGRATGSEDGWQAQLDLDGPAQTNGTVAADLRGAAPLVDFDITVPDLTAFVPSVEGSAQLTGQARGSDEGWRVDADLDGPYQSTATIAADLTGEFPAADFRANIPDLSAFAEGVPGGLTLTGTARQTDAGTEISTDFQGPYASAGTIDATLEESGQTVRFDARVPDLSAVSASLQGAANVDGIARGTSEGWFVQSDVSGPFRAEANLRADLRGEAPVIDVTASVPNLGAIAPALRGRADVTARATGQPDGWQVDADVTASGGAEATLSADLQGDRQSVTADVSVPNISALVPGVPGTLTAQARATGTPEGWAGSASFTGPYGSSGTVDGDLRNGSTVDFNARLPDIGALGVPISGPLALNGTARQSGEAWVVDANVDGPGGTTARVSGQAAPSPDLAITGTAPLGLANALLDPQSVQGTARFDLSLQGTGLDGLSGNVAISDTTLVLPGPGLAIERINGAVRIASGRANVDLTGRSNSGGNLTVTGPIDLADRLNADLAIRLDGFEVEDPTLYTASFDGRLAVRGPLSGGAAITGQIDLIRAEITIPNTFLGGLSEIPDITHVNPTRPVMRTLDRADLLNRGAEGDGGGSGGGGASFPLDITINAPGQVFVRGRGLDAELGGQLRITGTTSDIISTGSVDLRRGRLDILGERFQLDEGQVQLLGDFDPFIRFVATTQTPSGDVSIVIEGRASSPDVSFTSEAGLPEDEVLSQLLFGRDLSQISALQALELANAVATLAGRGGVGITSRLRDSFGLDDLDVGTNAEGETEVTVGKYISDNVYTDVTVTPNSGSEVSLNIDLTPNITARGSVASTGETSLGIFFEKDY